MRKLQFAFLACAFGLVASCHHASVAIKNPSEISDALIFPKAHWERAASAESVGFSSAGMRVVSEYVRVMERDAPQRSPTGILVIAHGRVLFESGDTTEVSYLASIRKSVLAMLFGRYVESGKIRLDQTIGALGIDDVGGLLPSEKEASIEDLLTARSGVFHPASNPGDDASDAPPRGSQLHGRYFLYNNWDFNALGTLFEKLTGRDLYDALASDLARPIGMEDFRREAQKRSGDSARSIHPAYHVFLSTRDMARLGYLMLRDGDWDGAPIVPRAWIHKITAVSTKLEELNPIRMRSRRMAFGHLWWVFDDAESRAGGPLAGAFSGEGAVGQFITVIPKLDVVIAVKTVPGRGREVSLSDYLRFVDLLVAARNINILKTH